MRSKKTYSQYKDNENVRFPTAAWLLDRSWLYVAVLLVAMLAIGTFMKMGWDSYNDTIKQPEVITPYADVQPVNFTGKSWAEKLITMNPANLATWTVDKSTKPRSAVDAKVCAKIGNVSTSLLSTHAATSEGTEVRVQVYGAGQASKQFATDSASLNSCFGKVNVETSGKSSFAVFPKGFILTSGDAIVGVSTVNDQVRDTLLDFYLKNVEPSLIESGCQSLIATPEDANRSLFYNPEQYTGLKGSTNLETAVDINGIPTPTSLQLNEIANISAKAPEAPLPTDFPVLPKDKATRPAIPAPLKNEDSFKDAAIYNVEDPNGPGCGWNWTAQVSPDLDLKKLASEKKGAIQLMQGTLDGSATSYVSGKLNWALQVASMAPSVDVWNTFVNQTNLVHGKWEWLDSERDKLEPSWRQYVTDHDFWMTFDQRKADALKKFDEDFKKCQLDEKSLSDWKKDWQAISDEQDKEKAKAEDAAKAAKDAEKNSPTPSPTATPSATPSPTATKPAVTVPPKPAGCSTPPEEPAIASQAKPAEPKAPTVPVGVTIPASWPTPKTS